MFVGNIWNTIKNCNSNKQHSFKIILQTTGPIGAFIKNKWIVTLVYLGVFLLENRTDAEIISKGKFVDETMYLRGGGVVFFQPASYFLKTEYSLNSFKYSVNSIIPAVII